jgi:nitroreductase
MATAPIPAGTLIDALHWRYATKKFDAARTIPEETWAVLEQVLVLSPSSYGLQPWKFVVVRDRATREKLSAAAYGQTQPLDCSHFVVFAERKNLSQADVDRFMERTASVRSIPVDSLKGYAGVISGNIEKARKAGYLDVWMSRQVYIALGGFMTAAALLGVDACPMEGIEPEKMDEILGLSGQGYGTLCCCAAGYRSGADAYAGAAKVRYEPREVVAYV